MIQHEIFITVFIFLSTSFVVAAQTDTAFANDMKRFQDDLVNEYRNPATSPLSGEAKKNLKAFIFFR